MSIHITSNGSKWFGQSPDPVEKLIEVLYSTPLDPRFEVGAGVSEAFVIEESGTVRCFGNFATLSHVFNLRGTREELAPVILAIEHNVRTPAYQERLARFGQLGETIRDARRTMDSCQRPASIIGHLREHHTVPYHYGFNFGNHQPGDVAWTDGDCRGVVLRVMAPCPEARFRECFAVVRDTAKGQVELVAFHHAPPTELPPGQRIVQARVQYATNGYVRHWDILPAA